MQVSKWGNSLAVRLPKTVVDALGLKEGDDVKVEAIGERHFGVRRAITRDEALQRIKSAQISLPEGFKLNREELYER